MKHSVITTDVAIDATTRLPGEAGILLVKQDDLGGHIINLKDGNNLRGGATKILLNTYPRAVTRLQWERYADAPYWLAEVISPGIKPTTLPTFHIDDVTSTLDIFHQLGYSEILMSTNGGPWLPFTGPFPFARANRPAGYWRAKIKANEPTRLESLISYSNPTTLIRFGFDYDHLPLTLS